MKERIKAARKAAGLKQAELAEKLGVKPNTITSYETGLRVPSDAIVISMCRELNVSEHWLRTGEGEMSLPKEPDAQLDEILGQIASGEDELIKKIIKAYWALDDKEKAAIRKPIDGLCEK